jgi:subtilisin-like proprotein convertase family protein
MEISPHSHRGTPRFQSVRPFLPFFFLVILCALGIFPWNRFQSRVADARTGGKGVPVQSRTGNPAYRSPGNKHKFRITSPALARQLKAAGARTIADYASFSLLSVDEQMMGSLQSQGVGELRDEENLIQFNGAWLDTTSEKAVLMNQSATAADLSGSEEDSLHVIQFAGPVKPEWYASIASAGLKVVSYIPNNAYLVYGNPRAIGKMRSLASRTASIQWDSPHLPEFKLGSRHAEQKKDGITTGSDLYAIQMLADGAGNQSTMALINGSRSDSIRHQFRLMQYQNVIVKLPVDVAEKTIAFRPDVISVNRYIEPVKFDERQNIIMTGMLAGSGPAQNDYLSYLASQGFTQAQFAASGFAVNVVDSGIDNATTSPNHFALYTNGQIGSGSRVIFNRLEGTPNTGSTLQGCDGHGNLNAHIVGGFVPSSFNQFPHIDAAGFRYGLGVAPFVRMGSSVIFDPDRYTFPNFTNIESRAYNDGARISSNSWGSNSAGAYTIDSQAYDYLVRDAQPSGGAISQAGNQQMVILFAAGNQGPSASSVGSPGTAKNVITVGAAENARAFGGNDGCGAGDDGADNANDIAGFSSRGPTMDGRQKPDIVAPGTHITGGVAQVANPGVNGQANSCYAAGGVCGGLAGNPFFPAGQQFYSASTGTSHSTPAAAGAAALLRQHFLNLGLAAPSPAMTKAVIMNSARYLNGAGANDSLWSNSQGMGEIDVTSALGLVRAGAIIRDQRGADTFTETGQTRSISGTVTNSARPFRVTLAWTDAPGSTVGASYVNNLNLEVTVGGQTYLGNVFNERFSGAGGTADARNNAESVFLPTGTTGAFVVKVIAANIAGDGVPNSGGLLDQDFAIIVDNAQETPQAVLSAGAASVANESCSPANGAIDPGEVVTVNIPLQNVGTLNANNLVATLQPSANIINPSAPETYGVVAAGGAAVTRSFTFTAGGTCGSSFAATLSLQDGTNNLGTVTVNYQLGTTLVNTGGHANTNPITIPSAAPAFTSGPATPYPSNITVSGLTGTISNVSVTLNNLTHTFPDDLDVLLVGPNGQSVLLMSDAGGSDNASGINLTFNDSAAPIPDQVALSSGAYSPGNYGGSGDAFPAPAPVNLSPDPQRLAVFNGTTPNGTWSLYIVDDGDSDVGSIQGGWSISITTSLPSCCSGNTCSPIAINPQTVSSVAAGTAFSQTFTQSGGMAPVSFGLSGAPPAGIVLNGATLSGTPTQTGTYNFTISALDSLGCTGNRNYALTVTCPSITILPATLADGRTGIAYSQTLSQSGGTAGATFQTGGAMPPGLSLSPTGLLSGTPSQAGTYSIVVNLTDTTGCTASRTYPLTIRSRRFVRADYDGDGISDLALWRASNGMWTIQRSSTSQTTTVLWGAGYAPYNDVPVTGDFDGDDKADIAVWRAGDGYWHLINSSDNSYRGVLLGTSTDRPVPADYDGDGKTDLAVFQDNGTWQILQSTNNQIRSVNWGAGYAPYNDIPAPADFDGDGKADLAVWRPPDGAWYIILSSNNSIRAQFWGNASAGDRPHPQDFDNDGKADFAVFRNDGRWLVYKSSDNQSLTFTWGAPVAPYNDLPGPCDYDGDGKTDPAVWRGPDRYWYILLSSTGNYRAVGMGTTGDAPINRSRNGARAVGE